MQTIAPPTTDQLARAPMRNRVIRCDDDLWDDAMAQAAEDGMPLSSVIRFYLHQYGSAKRQSRESSVKGSPRTRKRQSPETSKRQSRGRA